jgi:hypothetical protein
MLARLAARLAVTRPVKLLQSAVVKVPTAIGAFRPAILLPASVFTGLPTRGLEALIAHELAHALIRDAYQEFREHDRDRLLSAVSRSLLDLTSGRIGPIEAPGSLADATVHLGDRQVELRSPPLSYGEFHAALFGVRLGASDFHARSGIRPPMIVDEPFAYLDLDRARDLWRLLCAAARERQVFVVTQETLTLDALGVVPDIVLPAALSGSALPAGTSPSGLAP